MQCSKIKCVLLFWLFTLAACGGGGGGGGTDTSNTITYDGSTLSFNLDIPSTLTEPPIPGLQIYVTLNGGSNTPMVVDTSNNTLTGQITNITAGAYQLQIVYFDVIGGIDTMLATYTRSVTLVAGQSISLVIADADLDKNIDDDGDGYTNLAELRINTDPHNMFDSPATLPIFAVGHGSFASTTATVYSNKSIIGEAMTGTANSVNFQVTAGFSSY